MLPPPTVPSAWHTHTQRLFKWIIETGRNDWAAGVEDIQYTMNSTVPEGLPECPLMTVLSMEPRDRLLPALTLAKASSNPLVDEEDVEHLFCGGGEEETSTAGVDAVGVEAAAVAAATAFACTRDAAAAEASNKAAKEAAKEATEEASKEATEEAAKEATEEAAQEATEEAAEEAAKDLDAEAGPTAELGMRALLNSVAAT